MRLSRHPRCVARAGFTLIELLTVIAIIGILVALTTAAVMKAKEVGPRTTTRYEIGQLEVGVNNFQQQYNVSYIPSRIILRHYLDDYFVPNTNLTVPLSQLDQDSVTYLTMVFKKGGQAFKNKWSRTTAYNPNGTGQGIAWHSTWNPPPVGVVPTGTAVSETLEGEQCLVFFLGGIQVTNPFGTLGFSTDDANPDGLTGTRNTFYEFKGTRMFVPVGQTYFCAYQDAYYLVAPSLLKPTVSQPTPYLFFSSYGITNGYNKYATPASPLSDCASFGVWPYAESNIPVVRYVKSNTCQIISAGRDGFFGPGTNLSLPAAQQYYWNTNTYFMIPKVGLDDQANFAAALLQSGQ
jgi:prepilin-type N-terminal cleavage/methylation domain-containing protein